MGGTATCGFRTSSESRVPQGLIWPRRFPPFCAAKPPGRGQGAGSRSLWLTLSRHTEVIHEKLLGGVLCDAIAAACSDGTSPRVVPPVTSATLALGHLHTCALISGGAAYCWGYNVQGQLGVGDTAQRTTPVAVAGGLTLRSRSAADDRTHGLMSRGGL